MEVIKVSIYTLKQEKQIANEYIQGVPVEQLVQKYGFKTRKSITDKVKKFYPKQWEEIKNKRKVLKKGYNYQLEKIECEFDAYFIGLLLTDGYVARENQIGIDLIDEDCIKFLSEYIGKKYNTYPPYRENEQTRYRLLLTDKILVNNLERFGIIKNKTLNLQGPQLLPEEEQFIPYIIRGIIDGDGTIGLVNNSIGIRITTASYDFAEWLRKILTEKLFLKNIKIHGRERAYVIETYKKENIEKIISLVYDKPFGMSRKYNKIRKMFNDYNMDLSDREDGIV